MKKKGFTLIELLVVIAIIAILAAILFPVFARARENARRASCQSNLKQIALGVFQYTQDYDEKFPKAVLLISGSSADPTNASPSNPYGWADALQPYLKSTQIYQCPSETGAPVSTAAAPWNGAVDPTQAGYTDYWYNISLSEQSQAAIEAVALTVMNGDGNSAQGYSYYYYNGCNVNGGTTNICDTTSTYSLGLGAGHGRHLDGGNFAFADGHVKWLKGNAGSGTTIDRTTAVLPSTITVANAGGKPTFSRN